MQDRNNPIVIFAENHADEITSQLMCELLPAFELDRYDHCLDETPENISLSKMIEAMKMTINYYKELQVKFKEQKLNIVDLNDIRTFTLRQLYSQGIQVYQDPLPDFIAELIQSEYENYEDVILRHPAHVASLRFYENLMERNISYSGMDIVTEKRLTNAEEEKMMAPRDKMMATKIVSKQSSTFGRIGLAHVEGIQKEILRMAPHEDVATRYLFIYVYIQPPERKTLNDLETIYQQRRHSLPFDILIIDANGKKIKDTAAMILKEIGERRQKLRNRNNLLSSSSSLGFYTSNNPMQLYQQGVEYYKQYRFKEAKNVLLAALKRFNELKGDISEMCEKCHFALSLCYRDMGYTNVAKIHREYHKFDR